MRKGTMTMLAALCAAGMMCAASAQANAPAPTSTEDTGARTALAAFADSWPASPRTLATTSGDTYRRNLDARIDSLRALAGRSDVHRAALAGALYHRYRLFGAEADLAAVRAVLKDDADAAVLTPVRAAVLSGMHRFADAAKVLGKRTAKNAESFREIDLALGRYAELRVTDPAQRQPGSTFYDTVWRGNIRALAGDLTGASMLFRAAQSQYSDSSPVPLAWLYAQQGVVLLRYDQCADAEPFLRAAIARLPGYVLAEDHLAECLFRDGKIDDARRAYESLVARTGNPEFMGQLALIAEAAGDRRAAKQWERRAERQWQRWLSDDEAAHAQHAAAFYLRTGDAKRADALAKRNLAVRGDVLSLVLAARTAHAVGDVQRMRTHLRSVRATGLAPPELLAFEAEVGDTQSEMANRPVAARRGAR